MSHSTTDEVALAFLHAHGIQVLPEQMGEMLLEAVARLKRTLYPADPRTDLTVQEVDALERGGFDLTPRALNTDDPLARTAAEYAALLDTGLTASEAARRLEVDPSRIRQRLTCSPPTLYGIRLPSGWRIPAFQFQENSLYPGFEDVVAALPPDIHPLSFYRWFVSPDPDLVVGLTEDEPLCPRDWLRLGQSPRVLAEKVAVLGVL